MCTRTLIIYLWIICFVKCYNESDILLDIYQNTNGEHWFIKWNVSTIHTNPCDGSLWGIKCLSNHIVAIHLPSNNLTGTIPNSISNLRYLSELNMDYNQLHGSIPQQLFTINTIEILSLSHNKLSGSIIINDNGLSTNLKILSLNNNGLSSSIPSNLFNILSLRILKVQNNALSDFIPSSFSFTNIEYAYFSDNDLHGIIPRLPSSIMGITLHNNDFTFNSDDNYFLNDFLFDLNSKMHLSAITMYNNRNLYGDLSSFNTSSLKIFLIHSCQIHSTLPSSLYFVPSHISLINNRLSSTMTSDFITPYSLDSAALEIALFGQGNKFELSNPLWISNSILNTNSGQLFYTAQLKILEVFIIIIVFGIVLFLILYNIHRLNKEKLKKMDPLSYMELKKNDPLYSIVHSQPYSFFSQLKDISRYLYFPLTLLFALLTSILYYSSSNKYYSKADFLLKWSIVYIGSATPQYNSPETVSLLDKISQWIASIYVVVYVAFTLYLYYIFYYRFTFPILFYQKIRITNSFISYNERKSSPMIVQSISSESDEYYYTLSGKKKKKSVIDQETKLLFDKSIFIPSNIHKNRYDSFDDDDLSISLNPTSERDIVFSDDSSDGNGKKSDIKWSDIEIEEINNNNISTEKIMKISNNNNISCFARNKRKLIRSFKTIFWSLMFIVCECIIIFYFATISIPNDNIFSLDFNGKIYCILRYCVWIVIAVCNSFIIPRISKKLVKKLYWICFEWNREQKLRGITVTSDIIRSLNLVWIPMILLFFMHNDCARYSNYYWIKCNDKSYSAQFRFLIGDELIDIKSSICCFGFNNSNYQIDYGKCFRSILEEWGVIIIFSSFGYIVCMMAFWLYSVSRYYLKLRKQYLLQIRKLGSIINVEYAEIWNHVQIVVIFGCCLPFVIPMMAFLLLVNKWVYSSLLSFNFRLSDVNPYFPAQLLIITNALQQMMIILFMWANQIQGRYAVTIADIIIDFAFAIWWFWYRNTVITKKKIISTHKLEQQTY